MGDYGAFWNPDTMHGFAWANVDHASDFSPGITACPSVAPSAPEPNGVAKNRYIAVLPRDSGQITALRVTLISLQHPDPPNLPQFPPHNFAAHEGQVRWVGPPADCQETEFPHTTFKCAALQCQPQYMDWSAVTGGQVVYVTGPEVLPSSTYAVESIAQSCDINQTFNYSSPLTITTARWGDVSAPFQPPSPAPLTQPNITDVAACVDKFKGVPNAISVARADINPSVPNNNVDISDIASIVDGFRNLAYPFQITSMCP